MSAPEWREVALCVFRRADRILVSEGVDRVDGEVFLRPPGGGIEVGESPQQAVVREIEEELQLAVQDVRLLGVLRNEFTFEGRSCREITHVFEADFVEPTTYDRDEIPLFEHDWRTARWMAISSWAANTSLQLYPSGLRELLLE
jgi:8-oxo-dGTP pyrophosphatase MutT (NUDIX family)